MCRNIKILRAPYAVGVTDDDVHAAALEYVRTVGGVRLPGPHHEDDRAAVALANKIARIAWKLMLTPESYNANSITLVPEV